MKTEWWEYLMYVVFGVALAACLLGIGVLTYAEMSDDYDCHYTGDTTYIPVQVGKIMTVQLVSVRECIYVGK